MVRTFDEKDNKIISPTILELNPHGRQNFISTKHFIFEAIRGEMYVNIPKLFKHEHKVYILIHILILTMQ
jgi:hypothetical protein